MCFSNENLKKIAFYEEHYQIIVNLPLADKSPIRIQDEGERLCRFCGKGENEVTFKNKAHAIPELLGNKSIFSMNECNKCNEYFAKECEDHLAKWFGSGRSLTQMHGKKGVPKFKTPDIRVEMGDKGLALTITKKDVEKMNIPENTPFEFKIPVEMPTQAYTPIRAAQTLVKSAISVLPQDLLSECEGTIAWLLGRSKVTISNFPVLYSFTPGPNPYVNGKAMILNRKLDKPMPFLWFIVATSNYRFQIMVPFCKRDTWISSGENTFKVAHFPVPFDVAYEAKYGKSEFYIDNWAGEKPIVQNRTGTFHVDRAERIN
jgi:hypothetical protein